MNEIDKRQTYLSRRSSHCGRLDRGDNCGARKTKNLLEQIMSRMENDGVCVCVGGGAL